MNFTVLILVICLTGVTKCPDLNNVTKEGFSLDHSSRVESIMKRKSL